MDKLLKYLTKLEELEGLEGGGNQEKKQLYISKINYYYDLAGGVKIFGFDLSNPFRKNKQTINDPHAYQTIEMYPNPTYLPETKRASYETPIRLTTPPSVASQIQEKHTQTIPTSTDTFSVPVKKHPYSHPMKPL